MDLLACRRRAEAPGHEPAGKGRFLRSNRSGLPGRRGRTHRTTPLPELRPISFTYLRQRERMHAEGPDHIERMKRAVAEAEAAARQAPAHLQPVFQFSLSQARANLEVISRFGRFPHRNVALSRASTAEELAYIEKGDFVNTRQPPA